MVAIGVEVVTGADLAHATESMNEIGPGCETADKCGVQFEVVTNRQL